MHCWKEDAIALVLLVVVLVFPPLMVGAAVPPLEVAEPVPPSEKVSVLVVKLLVQIFE